MFWWLVTVPELKAKSKIAFSFRRRTKNPNHQGQSQDQDSIFLLRSFSETARVGCLGRRRLAFGGPCLWAQYRPELCVRESVQLAVACAQEPQQPRVLRTGLGACCRRKSCGSCRARRLASSAPRRVRRAPRPGTRVPPGPASVPPAALHRPRLCPSPTSQLGFLSPPNSLSPSWLLPCYFLFGLPF